MVFNLGDSIGYINLTPWNSCWAQPFDQKKKMLGTKRREVGGKVDVQPPRERNGHDAEPVVYTAMPDKCYDELCDELAIQGSIDFDAADGLNALSRIEGQRQYTGVTWTTCHSKLLMDHLVDQVFFRMTSVEKSRLFDPTLASIIGDTNTEKTPNKNKRKYCDLPSSVPKKPRAAKKIQPANDDLANGDPPRNPDGKPATGVPNKSDKRQDLLNILKTLKKPGTSAAATGQDDLPIDDDDGIVSDDEE